ncbi:hypothetical protein A8V01_14655 [Novosphingobium guangzhouense]|uniref:Transglycosylase SLT domain-containing protein n=2 Tax=Novosphingobium guangzhouense TaxID=1850347 RepID=A0A2K2G437_9SPHN|nr:hypothetical protein A8V01_14655 [Novosphingobium guangzhouense]
MSVADTLEFDPQRVRPQGPADTRPAPGFLDTAAAAFRYARDDQTGHTDEERQTAYGPVVTALKERGYDPRRYINPYGAEPVNYDAVWRDIAAARKSDPDAFKEIGDRAAFEGGWRSNFAARQARDAHTMERGGLAGQLAGGLVGSLTDPVNVGGMVLTGGWGGTSIAGRMLAEAGINAGIELLETPLTAAERAKQGRELTAEEIAMNVGFAAVGGAAFKGLEIGAPKALAAGGRAAGKAGEWTLDQLPTDLQAAITLRRAKPDFAMTPGEAAALHVVARGTAIDATNPFAHTYDGLEAHAARIDQTIAAMARWPEAAAVQALAPAARRAAVPSGVSADFAGAWRAIIGIEGGTNRDGSFRTSPAGAIGPAQVMPDTAPEAARLAGLPFDERRYRSDPAYNEALGQAYYREMLRQFDGDAEKAAAAYNAGPGSARKGTGLRGAMARAQRAGVPNDWVSFLPAETRAYVADFRRRTGGQGGDLIDIADGDGIAPARPAALDAERPLVERSDFDVAPDRDAPASPDLPELRRDMFASDAEWRRAQGEIDAEAFGMDPAGARRAVWIEARDQLMGERGGEVPGALWHQDVGSIDVKWGNDKGGLSKIAEKHPEVLEDLPALLEAMGVKSRSDNRIVLQSLDHKAVVRLDYDGQAQTWLLSAYQVKGKAPPRADYRGASGGAQDRSPALGAGADIGGNADAGKVAAGNAVIPAVRRGDFYEVTGPDAPAIAKALGVAVTKTREGEPLVGIPAHAFDSWAADLADKGFHLDTGDGASRARGDSPALRDEMEAEGGVGPAVADADAGKAFDDPSGDPVGRVADLAWHDAQRAATAREAPEQLTFDLGDGKGERTIADIEAELKADEDAIATIESCLLPVAPAAGGAP